MEKRRSFKLKLQLLLFLLLITSYLSSTFSLDFLPFSHGCFWTDSCQNKWFGGCGAGHVLIDHSDDCNGLCPEPGYDPCLPFHTHFHCCKSESPKVTDKCAQCKSKVDFGDEYVCCMDCSDPSITDKTTKVGYCKTGAELAVQQKPRETFKWVTGPWMPCSSPCDGGVRYRDMECYGQLEDMSVPHYPVDESRCSNEEMPPEQEACNLKSCEDMAESDSLESSKRSGMSGWLVMLLILVSISAIGGLGFAGYTLYKRRTSTQQGFVYIMLEGYS
ncbi:hypothetical protein MKX01_000667 [Papaver californicum]|nr:hypothetical protein MKX01_000667 [Papaver californicum]